MEGKLRRVEMLIGDKNIFEKRHPIQTSRNNLQRVKECYVKSSSRFRFYVFLKSKIFPIEALERLIPKKGQLLDLGCGNGFLTNYFARCSWDREILGVDCSREKIKEARRMNGGSATIRFECHNVLEFPVERYDIITMIDLLYLLPFSEQKELLFKCFNALNMGGVLILKEMGRRPFWKYLINYLQEFISVKVLKRTTGNQFYFRNSNSWFTLLEQVGFQPSLVDLSKGYWYPHFVLIGVKRSERNSIE